MGANRTSFLANRRLQPLGHLSDAHRRLYRKTRSTCGEEAAWLPVDGEKAGREPP